MTVELWMLAASIALGMIHLIASSHLISWQRGYRWTASSREEAVPPFHGLPHRVDQATTNFLETFPFVAVLVLIAHVINHHSAFTIWGVHLYFWARLAYLIAAAIGLGLVVRLSAGTQPSLVLRCSLSRCSEEAKSNRSRCDYLRRGSSFGGRTRRQRCS